MKPDDRYVCNETDTDYGSMGGKAGAFARLSAWALPVPQWFVVKENAFHDSLSEDQKRLLQGSFDPEAFFESVVLSQTVRSELNQALKVFPPDVLLAVRSSARSEDSGAFSFAGQFDSVLNVTLEQVEAAIVEVWKSGFSSRIQAYRQDKGMAGPPEVPSVLIQQMVRADTAGVAFGADPVTEDLNTAVISAVYGLGSALVGGEMEGDTYRVRLNAIEAKEIVRKELMHPFGGGPDTLVPVPDEKQNQPALSDAHILEVAALVRQVGRYQGRCQDIEWAYEGDQLYLLQARPITSLGRKAAADGLLNIWDNSNIAESYGGVTTPLTFSFIRKAYEHAYREMCVLFSVPPERIEANDAVFSRMLGLIEGRVYYNLLSWYKVLAMLPGYRFNRTFMEQMMGVKESIPNEAVPSDEGVKGFEKARDFAGLLGSIFSLMNSYRTLDRRSAAFYKRLEEALDNRSLETMGLDQLGEYYKQLEQKLLTRWDAPLVNDFFAMIFYGILRSITGKWCRDDGGTLHNDLLCGAGDIISAQPAKRIRKMAEAIQNSPELIAVLSQGSLAEIRKALPAYPEFREMAEAYVAQFGDRCLDELKLESETLHEHPLPLYRSVAAFSMMIQSHSGMPERNEEALRKEAEKRAAQVLRGNPLKKWFFFSIARQTRKLVSNRENLRFERTRLFGSVRQIFLQMGSRLASFGVLDDHKDVFFLEVHELLGFADGTATTHNLKGLAALRKQEMENNSAKPGPDERFDTRGAVWIGNDFRSRKEKAPIPEGQTLQGLGCCPGIVQGTVRVIRDPRGAQLNPGEILVAERTDPGWIMLFPAASGILVARGSLLSHAAIVAREMGIPAVVSLSGVTEWLKDGDKVTLDGTTGIVTKETTQPQSHSTSKEGDDHAQ